MRYSTLLRCTTLFVGVILVADACFRGSVLRSHATSAELIIPLAQTPDLAPDRWRGMSNIFFDSVPPSLKGSVRTGDGWRDVQVAGIIESEGMQSVRALRFRGADGEELRYLVDTVGDLDFRHGQPLVFDRRGALRVANIDLTVRNSSGSQRRVPYQVLVADDGYTYARIADYRTANIRVDGQTYAVSVRNRNRGHPFYGADVNSVVLVDLNGDGRFAEQASVTVAGQAVAAEQVTAHTPFVLHGHALEVTDVDSAGTELRLKPSNRSVAVAVKFRAPEIRAELLSGGEFRLSNQVGKVVLIEFWATDCAYSEKVRSAANALAESSGERLMWVAVSKERDRAVIEQHLLKAPMRAIITLADSAAWATYNPAAATPFFVVADQRGIVQFTAVGASAMDAVTATVDRLLRSSLPP